MLSAEINSDMLINFHKHFPCESVHILLVFFSIPIIRKGKEKERKALRNKVNIIINTHTYIYT